MHYSCDGASLLIPGALRPSCGNQKSSPIEAFMTNSDHCFHQLAWERFKQTVSSRPILRGSRRGKKITYFTNR